MEFSYYPGCSLEATAQEYNQSALAVAKALGWSFKEIDDWICCGATSAHSTNESLSYALPAANIAMAQDSGRDVVVPCASCYNRLKKTDHLLRNNPEKKKQMEDLAGFNFSGTIEVMSLLETFATRIKKADLKSQVTQPLEGLKVVCYYGCLLVRPTEVNTFDNPENPRSLDDLMTSIGAQPLKWSYKTDCCGASLSLTATGAVVDMVSRITDMALEAGAQAIVTSCPLCQMNLETRRKENNNTLPVFYFTELMGLALGLKESNHWFAKHIIDPMPLLRSLSLVK